MRAATSARKAAHHSVGRMGEADDANTTAVANALKAAQIFARSTEVEVVVNILVAIVLRKAKIYTVKFTGGESRKKGLTNKSWLMLLKYKMI